MNALKKVTLWLLATSLVFAAAAMLIPKKALATIAALVLVTNDSSHPVPVSGDVGIKGTPTVQLAPGTTVGVTGGTFNFSNTPATPIFTRDKDNPALTPFQITLCNGLNSTGNACPVFPFYFTVGANQRLVIEYASVLCGASGSGSSVTYTTLQNTTGGTFANYYFPLGQPIGTGFFIGNQQTRIYADPGTLVLFGTAGSVGTGSGGFFCNATLSGYLVTP